MVLVYCYDISGLYRITLLPHSAVAQPKAFVSLSVVCSSFCGSLSSDLRSLDPVSWLQPAVATNSFNCSSQRSLHINGDSCNSSVLFLCHIAVFELYLLHTGSGLIAGAGGKSEWTSQSYIRGCSWEDAVTQVILYTFSFLPSDLLRFLCQRGHRLERIQ